MIKLQSSCPSKMMPKRNSYGVLPSFMISTALRKKQYASIASGHQKYKNPLCMSVTDVPSFTRRTARSMTPLVDGLCGVDVSCGILVPLTSCPASS